MTRLSCLSLCLALAVLTGGASSQASADTISFDMFLQNMTFMDIDGLQERTSQTYAELAAKVNEYVSPVGGQSEDISISDGGGCIKINVVWRNGNQTHLAAVVETLKKDGFTIWGQTWTVSFTGCADATLLRFKFYVVDMPWSDSFTDHASVEYQQLNMMITTFFSSLGGNIRALEIAQTNGCVEFYVEWNAMNATSIIKLTSELTTNGITRNDKVYRVQTKPCSVETTLLRFRFYVVNMQWSENFKNHNSSEYQELIQVVVNNFRDVGGSLRALEIAQNAGCMEFYVEWDALNATSIMDITSALKTNGLTLFSQHFMVDTKPCVTPPAETTLLRFRFYVMNMQWSENYNNHNSSEYQDLIQNIENVFIDLEGSIRALEIAQNSGCTEFYVEWETLNSTSILDVMSVLTTKGILINNQMYTVLSKPCTVEVDECPEVPDGTFGTCEMACSDNDTADIAMKCSDGFKCCSNGCGRTCIKVPAETTLLRFKFYIVNMTWSDNFKDHGSIEYLYLRQIIQGTFSNVRGSIRGLEIAKNYGCLEIYVEWNALDLTTIMDYMSMLKRDGITTMNQTYTVQTKPCEIPPVEVDECPEVPDGTFGTCEMACSDNNTADLAMKCSEGFRCCSNGCGRTCIRVGYTLKMNTTIVINMNVVESIDEQSAIFSQLQMAAKTMVLRSFNVEEPTLIKDVELTKVRSYSVQDQPLSLLDVVLYLHEDVPNADLKPGTMRLMKDGYSIENFNFRVIDVRLGSNSASLVSMCNGIECNGICKELRSDVKYCSCDSGYMGPDCASFDCRAEASLSSGTNNSMCENGGECVRKPQGLDFECQCQPGHYGPLCQVDLTSCPVLPARRPGLIGLCRSTCSGGDCGEDKLCCKVACGGNACVEVGYYQKMVARITLNFPYAAGFNDTNSIEFQVFKPELENWINAFIREKNVLGFKSANITSFSSSTDGQMARRKRDLSNTVVHLEIRFTEEIPVDVMFAIKDSILAEGYNDGGNTWEVFNVTYGIEGSCPYMTCAPGSFCVTDFGGELQCACPQSTSGQLCDVTTKTKLPCDIGLCLNNGICHNMPDGQHYCECPEGFSGNICEDPANHCPIGNPLMTTSGEQQCFRRPCPLGFHCEVHPSDKWTACCFTENFLCDLNPCKAGGQCISNFNSGTVCACPQGSKGLFCEEANNDTTVPTECQRRQFFSDWVITILKTGIPSQNITLQDMRLILQHLGYQYFPTDICDEQGNYKPQAQGVLVVNPTADRIKICRDKYGNYDSQCGGSICGVLSNNGSMEFCMNGGRCVGEITQQLCDCTGTGYHGIRCELSNADGVSETNCTLRRDIAYLAVGILNGSVDLMPGSNKETIQKSVKEILALYNSNKIFEPFCDEEGQYEYRGCIHMADDVSKKTCYCALDDGTNFGSEESPFEPPPNCRKDSCPEEWGEDCERPDWWCLEKMQCQPDTEKCAYYTGCTDDTCTLKPDVGCVAKGTVLPCDLHPCKDDPFSMCQPCGVHGSCYNVGSVNKTADMGYRCQCNMGFSGLECEINENICSHIPKDFCESHCVGDVSHGELCKCDLGYGGIFCDKPARSMCEKRKALYDDAISILSGEISARNGFSVEDMKNMLEFIIQIEGGNEIPVLNCTEKGFYAKVQCTTSVSNLSHRNCYCVDFNNNPISSNVKPYIGFDVCTAPSDMQELAQTACNLPDYFDLGNLTVCQNGGTCIFDIYAGQFCACPEGYHGQFCQYQENVSVGSYEPRSLCEFFALAWDMAHEISVGSADWITDDAQKELYLKSSLNFLQIKMNQSLGLKAECQDDGTFKPAACYHNIMTGEKESCYCWNLRGPNVEGLPVESADSDKCSEMDDDMCPKMKCRYVCEHGYRLDNTGCRTCECKNPCEDITCGFGQRCVIEQKMDCDKDAMEMTCTKAVCMSVDKPGACPGYSDKSYSSVPGGLLAVIRNSSSCDIMCYDDTDCEGQKKCCGPCGSMCVEPEVVYSCWDHKMKMDAQLKFINMARDELMTTKALSPADIRNLERITDVPYIWMPICKDGDEYMFNPLQCQNFLDISGSLGDISSCFCVDLLGKRIDGAIANSSDLTSCDIKPFTCPFVEPSQSYMGPEPCMNDLECVGNEKCCGNSEQKMCQTPVDTSQVTTTLDQFMSTLCEMNADMCQGGSRCVDSWIDEGIACECPSDRTGPFCEQLVSDVLEKPITSCERKQFAVKVFTGQLQETNSSLSFKKLLDSILDDNMATDIVTAVWYNCTADGTFEPKQCIVNAYDAADGKSQIQCFCVYENGMEILGTRTSVKDGQSVFCGENNMTCPVGNVYREFSNQLLECEGINDCPMGYTCRRSTYGRLYCCPTKEGLQDVCKQPKDIGMICPSDATGMQSGTYYYYNSIEGSCRNFTYNGCEGNQNRFSTMELCTEFCQQKIHPGTCPMNPVKVTVRTQCPDLCNEDDNCDKNYKCCSSTCGKRCIPAGGVMGVNICSIGQPREAMDGGMCNRTRPCEMGYMCVMSGNNSGACCPDYSNVDQCLIPPTTQHCQDFEERYFFNATSKMCQSFNYGGCDPDFNNFKSLEDCCGTCSGKGRCKLGQCPSVKPGTIATCVVGCSADGDCPGKKICCSNGCGTTCVVPEVKQTSDCLSQQMVATRLQRMKKTETSHSGCDVMSIPVCKEDGTWAREQCQTALGICWCVSPQGNYISNTITRGVPPCQTVSWAMIMRADQSKIDISQVNFSVCNNGKDIHCCTKALCSQNCWAHPDAVCRINPCGGCKAEYFSTDGRMVDCDEGLTLCEQELKHATAAIQQHQINVAMARGDDMDDAYRKSSVEYSSPRSLRMDYPGRCQLPPETGSCKGFQRQWYFDPASGKCNMFIWGMCKGNDNRFDSPEECYSFCSPSSNPCMNINCSVTGTTCELQYDEDCYISNAICNVTAVCKGKDPDAYLVEDIFVPSCQATGEYSYKQCHGSYCWCVNSTGQYINGLTVEQSSILMCTERGTSQDISAADGVCPNGSQVHIACTKACTNKICLGQPEAMCVVDLCSSDCNTKFVDKLGQEVTCTGDVCQVFTFEESDKCTDNVPCPGAGVKTCPMSVCELAMQQNCSKNPCAVCMVNPCTCQPYFVHANTHKMLTEAQCNFLSLGVCELETCNILSDNENTADTSFPECDDKGIYKPQQCQGSQCWCVDQFGNTTAVGADGSCKAIDKIKRIIVTFTFRADFNTFKISNRLQALVTVLLNKLLEAGIDQRIIKYVGEPYEGSIKVDVTIEGTADSYNNDLALILNVLEQMNNTGTLDLTIDGQSVALAIITKEIKTESQVAQENEGKHTGGGDSLNRTEKIIIGVVCGSVGLLIIGIICYCLCCRRKQKKEALDDSFEHVREGKKTTSPIPVYNQVYEDESNSVKVRL